MEKNPIEQGGGEAGRKANSLNKESRDRKRLLNCLNCFSPRLPASLKNCLQKFSDRLSTASAASLVASESEGWAWQMRAMSSLDAPNSIATTASEINSDAIGPTM